jgi:hypothetical protein
MQERLPKRYNDLADCFKRSLAPNRSVEEKTPHCTVLLSGVIGGCPNWATHEAFVPETALVWLLGSLKTKIMPHLLVQAEQWI